MDEKTEAIKELKQLFKEANFKVYTKLNHVSRSGMLRYVSAVVIIGNEPIYIDHLISRLGIFKRVPYEKGEGLMVHGCGMDVGFELVYNTARVVYADGFICRGEDCPSNAHVNGEKNIKPHRHSDPGYALRQVWI